MNAGLSGGTEPPGGAADTVDGVIARVYADDWGRIVATLIRLTGDWDLAEEMAHRGHRTTELRERRNTIANAIIRSRTTT